MITFDGENFEANLGGRLKLGANSFKVTQGGVINYGDYEITVYKSTSILNQYYGCTIKYSPNKCGHFVAVTIEGYYNKVVNKALECVAMFGVLEASCGAAAAGATGGAEIIELTRELLNAA